MIKLTAMQMDYILIDTRDTYHCIECGCVISKPDYALSYWTPTTGMVYLCSRHAKARIETSMSALKFQLSEMNQLLDRLPKKTKSTPDAVINLGDHL